MVIIKCKMCGGDLNLAEGSSVCECEYCGTRQTVPNADNEKKMTLFTRASRLLRNCEFDKASGVFEAIVADFPEEAEAYWGLVLCKYGIEYVDDPATGKKVPTCHRNSFESVEDDTNFEQACENADAIARRLYREEARQIETLRKQILEVSGKEEPYDIFISYKELDENGERTVDSVIAQDIYKALDKEGYRVFFSRISLEGKLGIEYEPYIFAALNSAKVMIVVGTDYDNFDAVWVKNEWSRFLKLISDGQQKTIIPVYKDMDPYDMPKELRNLAAQNMGKIGAMQDLLHGIEKLIPRKRAADEVTEKIVEKTVVQNESSVKAEAAIKRGKLALEDGEWEKAKQYFDQALTLDAECAEAYFGIALAELRAKDPESYIHTATSQIPKTEKLSIQENTAHIRKAAAENTVTGFLEESEITPLYRYDLSFSSYLKGQQELQNQVRQQIESNRNLSRALRFAAGEEKSRIEGFKKSLYEKLQEKVDNARKKEEEYRNRTKQNYEKFLKETDQKVYELKQEACAKQTKVYQNAVSLQEKAKTISDFQAAIAEFRKTLGFHDTKVRIQKCEKAIAEIQDQEEREKQTKIYQNAVSLQDKARTVSDYQEAIAELKKTTGFQDTESRIKSCERAITEIHDRERLEKEEQARKAAAKRKRTMAIMGILVLLAIFAFFVVTKIIIPKMHYANSNNLRIVGNTVTFGTYEQDNNKSNGAEPIEWIVLANEGNRSLLISRYALDCQQYNTKSEPMTWETCSLRSWLNSTFLNAVFTANEQKTILKTSLDNGKSQGCSDWSTNGGNNTSDQIFLLSYAEAGKYFFSDSDRICKPTTYVNSLGVENDKSGNCWWWLRSPGINLYAAGSVSTDGSLGSYNRVNYGTYAIRPAFWINLESEYFV